jgi:hypothetical protein
VYPGWLDGLVLAPIQRLPAGDRVCARRLAGLAVTSQRLPRFLTVRTERLGSL